MIREDIIHLLTRFPRFASAPRSVVEKASQWARIHRYQPDEIIFHRGDPPEQLGFILEGRVKAIRPISPKREVIMGIFGSGEVIGEVAVLENIPYPASVYPLKPTSLILLPGSAYLGMLREDPEFAIGSLRELALRIFYFEHRVYGNAGQAEFRLARLLFGLMVKEGWREGDHLLFSLPFSRKELASLTGLRLETITRLFSHWKEKGWIEEERSIVRITDKRWLMETASLDEEEVESLASLPYRHPLSPS